MKLPSENSIIHWDSNSQNESSLESVKVHSLTFFCTPGSMKCDSWALSWPTPSQALTLVESPTHTFLPNGFSMFACPHKQKILEEEDRPNEHTQCFVHTTKINNLCCFMQTFVASCLHTTKIDHCLPKHNQD